jgi:hypothetical protein
MREADRRSCNNNAQRRGGRRYAIHRSVVVKIGQGMEGATCEVGKKVSLKRETEPSPRGSEGKPRPFWELSRPFLGGGHGASGLW